MRKNVFFSEKKNPLISVKHSSLECNNFVNLNHGPHHKLKKDKKKHNKNKQNLQHLQHFNSKCNN